MRKLVALHYSPWSEKARWALDHHGVAYRYEEYKILLGEPKLRLATKKRARQGHGPGALRRR
jgi:glutathione S-transferase